MLTQLVPDLVFSEMKFLQKPESITKDEIDPKSKKKSRKKKPRQTTEKEIARYFDAGGTRPRDDERDQKRHTPPHDTAAADKGLQSVSPVVSDVLEKPFLGFGSRGTHPPTTSYYSWSESGRGSSARAKHFVPDLEPLAAGQLQGSQARKQKELVLLESDTAQRPSLRSAVTERHSKDQNVISEPARDIDQAACPPAKPRPARQTDTEGTPIPISDKHDTLVPAARSLANQIEAKSDRTKRDLTVPEVGLNGPKVNENYRARSYRSRAASNDVPKQHPEPWEELLQTCELAARPLMPTYYDEGLARYSATATQDQHTPATHGHADLRLWRTEIDDLPEHDYLDNTALVSECAGWAQPEVNEYQHDSAPFVEETGDDDFESLDSENSYDFPTENGGQWEAGDATQHDAARGYQFQESEAVDELAMFWQPNRLY